MNSNVTPIRKQKKRRENELAILQAAEKVFAEAGFGGATMQLIADVAGLPKANVHYYFKTKKDLYTAVLEDIVVVWKKDAEAFDQSDDPTIALTEYIKSKMHHSFKRPYGSKVWANETLHGAPVLGDKKLS